MADAQNRLDDAAGLYRRAVEANPQSFEAHVELGLLLARQNKLSEARPELAAATELDPGEAGAGAKARAWRALAQIDRADDPAKASDDLLEALKLSPETPDDTLLAAGLADQAGQNEAAEASLPPRSGRRSQVRRGQRRSGPPFDCAQAVSRGGDLSSRGP